MADDELASMADTASNEQTDVADVSPAVADDSVAGDGDAAAAD